MLFVDMSKNGAKKISIDGNAVDIMRELVFLVVYLKEAFKDKIDVRGLLKDDDLFNQVEEEIRRLEKEQSDDERPSASAES